MECVGQNKMEGTGCYLRWIKKQYIPENAMSERKEVGLWHRFLFPIPIWIKQADVDPSNLQSSFFRDVLTVQDNICTGQNSDV